MISFFPGLPHLILPIPRIHSLSYAFLSSILFFHCCDIFTFLSRESEREKSEKTCKENRNWLFILPNTCSKQKFTQKKFEFVTGNIAITFYLISLFDFSGNCERWKKKEKQRKKINTFCMGEKKERARRTWHFRDGILHFFSAWKSNKLYSMKTIWSEFLCRWNFNTIFNPTLANFRSTLNFFCNFFFLFLCG